MNRIAGIFLFGLVILSLIDRGDFFKSPWEYLTSSKEQDNQQQQRSIDDLVNGEGRIAKAKAKPIPKPIPKKIATCSSPSCTNYAKLVKSNLDESVNPCDDFYQFNCGNYIKNSIIPSDQSQASQFRDLDKSVRKMLADYLSQPVKRNDVLWIRNAKVFYSTCSSLDRVNHNTVLSVKEVIETLGGWPMMTGHDNKLTPLEMLIKLSDYQYSPFASITVMPNPKDPMHYIIKVYQPDYNPYQLYENPEYEKAYKTYLKTVLTILYSHGKFFQADIQDVFDLHKSLAKIQMTLSERKNGTRNQEFTVAQLQEKIPNFPWKELISSEGIFSNIFDFKVNQAELVSVDDWDYLVKMQDIYNDYSKNRPRVLQNFLIANFFYSTLNDLLPVSFLQAKLGVSKFLTGASTLEDRKMFCVSKAQTYIPNEIGKLYVSNHFGKSAKADALEMTKNILNQFKSLLKDLKWMDEASKKKALEKADYIKPQIGYPDNYDDYVYINSNYNYILDQDDFLTNVLSTLQYSQRFKTLGVLRKPVNRNEWFATPAIVNAFYEPSNNQIYFPAGILNVPFYDPGLPKYINYGAIGTVIGHEITHGFDDEGRHYDKLGRYYSDSEEGLWSQSTIDAFKSRVKCMIDQYNSFSVRSVNLTVNGYQTLGENIADNGGIKEAFKTYKKWEAANPTKIQPQLPGLNYTNDQLFFIGLAQVWCSKIKDESMTNLVLTNAHSPPEFRVIGMAQNSDEFQQAFNCPGTTTPKCTVW